MSKILGGIFFALFANYVHAGPIMEWNFTMLATDWFEAEGGAAPSDERELLIGTLRYESGTRTIKSISARSMDHNYGFSTYSDKVFELLYDFYTENNQYAWLYNIGVIDTAGKKFNFSFGEIYVMVNQEREYATLDNRMLNYIGSLDLPNANWNDPHRKMRGIEGTFFLQRPTKSLNVPEPASIGLMSLAVLGLTAARRRKLA